MTSPDAGFRDCLADPGPLTGVVAIQAFSLHCGCSDECRPRRRAMDALSAEYVEQPRPLAAGSPADKRFIEQLRTAAQLTANRDGTTP